MLQQNKGWGKNVIVMYTCNDNLIPLLYSGEIKKKKEKRKKKKKNSYNSIANKLSNLKIGRGPKQTFFPKKTYSGQQAHESLIIRENVNQNSKVITSHLLELLSSKR